MLKYPQQPLKLEIGILFYYNYSVKKGEMKMNEFEAVNSMFTEALTEAEVKAIARSRDFPSSEGVSRAVARNFFLTNLGLASVFNTLSADEIAALHLLASARDDKDITFFARVYQPPRSEYGQTFTQRYRETLKQVRERLVRKGVLLAWIDAFSSGAQIEKWRFAVPSEFVPSLPPILTPIQLKISGEVNDERVRRKVRQLDGAAQDDPLAERSQVKLGIDDGSLTWGGKPFQNNSFCQWQIDNWQTSLDIKVLSNEDSLTPIEAVYEVVHRLQPDEWFEPEQLKTLMSVQCYGYSIPDPAQMMEEGWKWGLFARRTHNRQVLYSPRFGMVIPGVSTWLPKPLHELLHISGEQVWVNLADVPAVLLNDFNQIARLKVQHSRLYLTVDLPKLARVFSLVKDGAVFEYLRQNAPAFRAAFEQIKLRWGSLILHTGCLVARVQNLSLRMQIERSFTAGVDYISLDGGWLAFRPGTLNEVEKIVHKSHFVVKKVTAR